MERNNKKKSSFFLSFYNVNPSVRKINMFASMLLYLSPLARGKLEEKYQISLTPDSDPTTKKKIVKTFVSEPEYSTTEPERVIENDTFCKFFCSNN